MPPPVIPVPRISHSEVATLSAGYYAVSHAGRQHHHARGMQQLGFI